MVISYLEEIKCILKSLVLSCPSGMTIEKLNRDFKSVEGYWIPFEKLGYRNLELFLCSLPDTLVVSGHGPTAKVGFISNKKLMHIDQLISKQKNTSYERKAAVFKQPQGFLEEISNAKLKQQPESGNIYSFRHSERVRSHQEQSSLNEISSKPTQKSSQLKYERYGEKNNLQQNWRTNDGRCKKYGHDLTNVFYTKDPVFQIKPPQHSCSQQKIERYAYDEKKNLQHNWLTNNGRSNEYCNDSTNETDVVSTNGEVIQQSCSQKNREGYAHRERNNFPQYSRTNGDRTNKEEVPHAVETKLTVSNHKSPSIAVNGASTVKHYSTKTDFCNVSNNSINNRHNDSYEAIPEFSVVNGASTIKQYSSKTDLFNVSKSDTNYNDSDKAIPEFAANSSEFRIDFPENIVKFGDRIKPYKIQTNNFIKTRHNDSDKAIPEFLVVNGASTIKQYSPKTDLFNVSKSDTNYNDSDEAIPEFAANSLVFRIDFPENTVKFGDRIKPYKIPEELKKGAVVRIFVAEIHNPYKFWFHMDKQNHELDFLMHQIERYYTKLDVDEFQIPISCITPGQICAALYGKLWHRAEILTSVVNNKTKVYFVDYGTVSEVAATDIKYLSTMFATITAQALRGSLSHIKPRGRHWSQQATKEFLSMVSERLLFAQITEIDITTRVAYMVVCDTNSNVTIQINNALVEKGVAVFDDKWEEHKKDQHGQRIQHPREEFPTFEMIEKGEYPSFIEMTELQSAGAGIDYERIIDRMIFHPDKIVSTGLQFEGLKELAFPLLTTNPFKCDIMVELCS